MWFVSGLKNAWAPLRTFGGGASVVVERHQWRWLAWVCGACINSGHSHSGVLSSQLDNASRGNERIVFARCHRVAKGDATEQE